MNPRSVNAILARQFGVISRRQAIAAGMPTKTIDRRVESREWLRVYRGVYRSASSERSWRQDLLAAQFHLGEGAIVSHRSAAALLGLEGVPQGLLEFTTPTPRERIDKKLILHTSNRISNGDIALLGPFRITTVTRTLIDLAAVECEETVEIALHYALRKGLTSLERLQRRLDLLSKKGRRGTRTMRKLLEVQPSTPAQSPMEVKLLRAIRKGGLPSPVLQFEVSDGDFHRYLDFAYPDHMVAIEADSKTFHSQPFDLDEDLGRRNKLTQLGWRVLHFPWSKIDRHPEGVAEAIRQLLKL